jgi:hypothetical protein
MLACNILSNKNLYRGGEDSTCNIGYNGKMCSVCLGMSNNSFYARTNT